MTDVVPWREPDLDGFWKGFAERRNDVPAFLRVVTQLVVDVIGDGCILMTCGADRGVLTPTAYRHRDPEVTRQMQEGFVGATVAIGEGLAGVVARDRRSIRMNDLHPEDVPETAAEPFVAFVRANPISALMTVPLVASGELVGTLSAIRTMSPEPYTPADLRMLETLAERAASAIADAAGHPRLIGIDDYEALFRNTRDGVMYTVPDGHIIAANPAACAILGLSEREIIDLGRDGLLVPEDPRLRPALAERAAAGYVRSDLAMRRGDGTIIITDTSSTVFTTPDGRPRTVIIFRDITEQATAREAELARMAELADAADHDQLTGLLNRRGFTIAAQQALATADRHRTMSSLLFVDLDNLKVLNDTRGHAAGDAAIRTLAHAVRRAIRDADVAGRLGGDEFVVLLADGAPDDVPLVIDRIRAELAADATAPPGLTFSAGIATRHPHGDTLDQLIDAADQDMYQHKLMRRLRRRPATPTRPDPNGSG